MLAIIADNQDITKIGLIQICTVLKKFSGIKEVRSKKELIKLLSENPDAVIILDYTLFDISMEYLQILQERFGQAQWILFSDSLNADFIRHTVFCNKAFSIVLKDSAINEIESSIQYALHSEQYICNRIAGWMTDDETHGKEKASPLTSTEKEILKSIALGKTTKEIASARCLSAYTVMTHRKNIFRKLKVNNIHEATKYAFRAGIIDAVEYYI